MTNTKEYSGLELRSLVKKSGELEVSLTRITQPELRPNRVLVRLEAAPINPSDLGLLFGAADMSSAKVSEDANGPVLTAQIPERAMRSMGGRLDMSLPVGNEGAGVVVAAGSSEAAQSLLGKTVAILGGAMYAQYRVIGAHECLVLPDGTTAAQGASAFVNPLTALGMVETMRREGHKALVHTAAASNLGQMLNRICIQDQVTLVNIVRKQEQVDLLKAAGAKYVCNTSAPTFLKELTDVLEETGATIAFDATGGGKLAGQILSCMEAALNRSAKVYSRYGSPTHKQVYIYGGLDTSPTEFNRAFGMSWGIGGFLLSPLLEKIGPEATLALKQRVAAEITTTFASHYAKEVSLDEALQLSEIDVYNKRVTGEKYLINPWKGVGQ